MLKKKYYSNNVRNYYIEIISASTTKRYSTDKTLLKSIGRRRLLAKTIRSRIEKHRRERERGCRLFNPRTLPAIDVRPRKRNEADCWLRAGLASVKDTGRMEGGRNGISELFFRYRLI